MYFVCRVCRLGGHPLDDRLGVSGSISPQAQRLLCLAGGSWSFDCAAKHLEELCGLRVSDNTVRAVCQQQAKQMAVWQRETPAAHQPFKNAQGDVEFTTDGTMVNTWEGWREMRLGIFSRRSCGEPSLPEQWHERKLPAPSVRVAFAAIEKSQRFGSRWGRWAQRLGIRDTSQVSVLADGARWIWEETSMHLAGATEVLDIYHALQRVSATAKQLHGEGTDAARDWSEHVGSVLIAGGWPAVESALEASKKATRRKADRASLAKLGGYLGRQPEHLEYAKRLAEGRSIGSGQVEGACRHMIGRRLKQTGARWRVRRVNRMASLCCLIYSDHWDSYWKNN